MKKLQILIILFLISSSIFAIASTQVKAQTGGSQFVFNTINSPQTAGTPFSITITAEALGVPVTTYSGTPNLIASTGSINPTITPAFSNGVWTGNVTVTGAGSSVTITANDGVASGTSNSFSVKPGVLDHFTISTSGTLTAGSSFSSVTVTAYDANGNLKNDYTGSIYFTSSDPVAILPYNSSSKYTFVSGDNGSHTFSGFTLKTTPSQTISVTDGSISKSSSSIIVNAAALDHFDFSTITSPQPAGTAITGITVTAKDSYENTVTSYASSTVLTETDGGAGGSVTQSPVTFANGVWSGSLTLTKSGSGVTITASGGGQTSKSNSFTVNSAIIAKFAFGAISSQTAGTAFNVVITAQDAYGNTVTSYTGNPTLTYSAGAINPPSSGVFASGTKTVSVTVTASGTGVSITATDGTTTGSSGTFTVNAGVATHLVVSSGTSQVAGTPFTITVTAKDVYENTATSYTGTIHFSSSDSNVNVVLPSNYQFRISDLGTQSFAITLMTAGTQSITVTDTATSSISGSQTGIIVNYSSGIHLAVSGFPNSVTAGVANTVTVTAKDASGNTITGYVGTIKITSSDANVVLPANAGVGSFTVTLETVGSQTITATNIADSSVTGSQSSITVNHAAVSKVVISPASSTVTAGASKIYTGMASDAFGNSWDATSLITWSASSGAGGSWSNNVYTSAKAGVWTISGTYASATNTAGLTVNPGSLDHFIFGIIGAQNAGSAFGITVDASDTFGNMVTSYSGSPSLTYSAGSINPITMSDFVSGIGSSSVTVTTSGSGVTITATDGSHSGVSNPFTVTLSPTSTPTPTPEPSPTPTPTPTTTPTSTSTPTPTVGPTPSPTPSPTPTPSTTVTATTDSGATVNLSISGNITSSQMSNVTISTNQSIAMTTVSFTLTGQSGTVGFGNMTIPVSAISYGTAPIVYIDGQKLLNQGYTQDNNNFYVWYTTSFSEHQVTIQFDTPPKPPQSILLPFIAINIAVIISILAAIVIRRKMKD